MTPYDVVIAVFNDHHQADAAVRKLIDGGFDMKNFSVVGKGYHTEEKIVGLYTVGDRMKMWGKYGAFWGGLWGLLMGGVFLTIPALGPIVVLGHLAVVIVSAVEGAVVVGTLSALGATLVNVGLPKESVVHYEAAIKADGFIVMAHGTPDEMARAKAVLATHQPARLDLHEGVTPTDAATPETI
ncbi:hypothetical protein DR64_7892 [Paraburkholderia xenovorans LB400]|uniref:General stress protein 17M-like domain-containing protein n=1 Tax=Paraburkholderia xenovorans (strain LB400) TaxID=266265 RepID=Q13HI5_PARXL|nr:general stress protein [Paraburkholderia xenovorans]ABE36454.1 Conserved hypothetical protein [Paraburkholderia xenovorans LB400]AIP34557.1 hypothetical protein DR64_7892 [Paraburkholderia xenovorans LB400]